MVVESVLEVGFKGHDVKLQEKMKQKREAMAMRWPCRVGARVGASIDDSSSANTRISSISFITAPIYSAAPEKWATLAQAIWRAPVVNLTGT